MIISKLGIINFLFGPFLIWLPLVINLLIVIIVTCRNIFKNKKIFNILKLHFFSNKKLIYIFFIFTILYNLFLTGLQYYIWHASALGRFFFPPFQSINYFINYSGYHFWLPSVLNLLIAMIFYGIICLCRKYNQKIIDKNEALLLFLVCLLSGWPGILIFLPLFFLVALFSSILNLLIFKNDRISILWTLIISIIITLFFRDYIIHFLNIFGY
jgi:hypothetical protein